MRGIIFSKDRACQLHLLLESLQINDPYKVFDDVHVIYTNTSDEFDKGYDITAREFPDVEFHKQGLFKQDVMDLLHSCESKLMSFFVDDIILYRKIAFTEQDINDLFIANDTSLACMSLRLGSNVRILYQQNRTMYQPTFSENGGFYIWNRRTAPFLENYNYPMSVDGHIFRTEEMRKYAALVFFNNPNEFESNLTLEWAKIVPPLMACPIRSVIVNSPINRVQDQYRNKFGTVFSFSTKGLNDKYLDGKRIDLDSINPEKIVASHQELEVKFK